jgi:hypothetical protein
LLIRLDLRFALGVPVLLIVPDDAGSGAIGVLGNVGGNLVLDILVLEPVLEGLFRLGVAGGCMLED